MAKTKYGRSLSPDQKKLVKHLYMRKYGPRAITTIMNDDFSLMKWKGEKQRIKTVKKEINRIKDQKIVKEERETSERKLIKGYYANGKARRKHTKARVAGFLMHYKIKSPYVHDKDKVKKHYMDIIRNEGSD